MGRQSRQVRRAKERRAHEKPEQKRSLWPHLGGLVIMAAVAVFLARQVLFAASGQSTPPQASAPTIQGIQCNSSEQVAYHEHAHLTVIVTGTQTSIPANTGIKPNSSCLYWLHTHDTSGVIHIEAPHTITPTLGNFFAVSGDPLSSRQVYTATVRSGQDMRVWVNQQPYHGDPRAIRLHRHTDITIEIGPPFSPPEKFSFGDL